MNPKPSLNNPRNRLSLDMREEWTSRTQWMSLLSKIIKSSLYSRAAHKGLKPWRQKKRHLQVHTRSYQVQTRSYQEKEWKPLDPTPGSGTIVKGNYAPCRPFLIKGISSEWTLKLRKPPLWKNQKCSWGERRSSWKNIENLWARRFLSRRAVSSLQSIL